ncbi:adenylate/guanylate cyclase domain-containing protein (plasmid) [Phyllobacterium sp. A18/5-2]|uniref:adenylate/guanylate cyclase domain-containing protein n=1 Tax=Phyllobacterium sp. A18/5-2 TaxID=2978392 RepID=UPI0021C73828|nr:adenylate/guanylate cyclase domain-containing protein [Phyllobacterium sp. A18/5-2]UXN67484.1 adenylate/guanylate cyclase domain-containing protein [Phyllobacterium sp. A18/5-2]
MNMLRRHSLLPNLDRDKRLARRSKEVDAHPFRQSVRPDPPNTERAGPLLLSTPRRRCDVKDGGIFGDSVNVAARLEAIAEPGGICVTRDVREHLRDRMDYEFEDLGEHRVKNISRPVRVFRVWFRSER